MKNLLLTLSILAGTGLQARLPQEPGIQHKIPDGCFNPMWDAVNEVWLCDSFEGGDGAPETKEERIRRCKEECERVFRNSVAKCDSKDNQCVFIALLMKSQCISDCDKIK